MSGEESFEERRARMSPEERHEGMERVLTAIFAPDIYDLSDGEEIGQWVVVTVDLVYGTQSYCGPYFTIPEAMAAAEQSEAEVNRGAVDGEPGWKCHIRPMFKPEP